MTKIEKMNACQYPDPFTLTKQYLRKFNPYMKKIIPILCLALCSCRPAAVAPVPLKSQI